MKAIKILTKKDQLNIKGGNYRYKCIDDLSCPKGYGCDKQSGKCLPIPL
jgi:hypothetical protein